MTVAQIPTSRRYEPHPFLTRRFVISGRVQGVGFRDFLVREALNAELVGWVRNMEDGRVETLLLGPRPAVEKIEAWCHDGPELALIALVQSLHAPDAEALDDATFVIVE